MVAIQAGAVFLRVFIHVAPLRSAKTSFHVPFSSKKNTYSNKSGGNIAAGCLVNKPIAKGIRYK